LICGEYLGRKSLLGIEVVICERGSDIRDMAGAERSWHATIMLSSASIG
jgi:hypothetical protein